MGKYPIYHARGSHQEVGLTLGKKLGKKLEKNIEYYIKRLDEIKGINHSQLVKGAIKWLRTLPLGYQVELENMALGAGCSVHTVASWLYSDLCVEGGCTSFIHETNDGIWVGRNNDYLIPGIWGYITIIEAQAKIPTMLFGLEGGTFSGTGYNKEKIWLHYNWLPERPGKGLPPFVFHRQALENCSSITDLEKMLKEKPRDGGMNLFVVDGKRGEYAVFECSGQKFRKREPASRVIAGANHYHFPEIAPEGNEPSQESQEREKNLKELFLGEENLKIPDSYFKMLGNPGVEARGENEGTVYSCVVCPEKDLVFYSADPYPAASSGEWEKVIFNW